MKLYYLINRHLLLYGVSLFFLSLSYTNLSMAQSLNTSPGGTTPRKLTRFNLNFEPGVNSSICDSNHSPYPKNELSTQIEELIKDFSSEDARVKNPKKFVAEIDSIISKTKLAPILSCRDQLNKTAGFEYALKFQDPDRGNQSMGVTTEEVDTGSSRKLRKTLEFNLNKSVGKAIIVYLHELTHICQAVELRRA